MDSYLALHWELEYRDSCWILTLGAGVPRLYTMSTPKTQKSWNQGERVHPTKLREKQREGGPVPPLHESVPISRWTFKIAYPSSCHRHLVRQIGPEELDTSLTSESDSKAAKLERHSSLNKNRGETKKEVLSEDEGDQRYLCNYCMSQYLD
jgi:hypothetical protein